MSHAIVANRIVNVDHVGRCVVGGMTPNDQQPRKTFTA